jgi:glycosyltransferase involved in cell wall biosynthesis
MKRAIILSPLGLSDSGGVERVMLYASRAFEARGHKVVVLDRDRLARSNVGRLFRPLIRGRLGFLFSALGYSLLAGAVRRQGDIVVSNGYTAPFVRADLLFCHGSMRGLRFATRGRRLLYGPEELLEACAGLCARRIAAVSFRARHEWERFYFVRGAKVRVLANCVDPTVFVPKDPGGEKGPPERIRVLFAGRLCPQKAPERLLCLVDYAEANRIAIDFALATPGAAGSRDFEGRANLRIRVGVPLHSLPDLYAEADVFFLPSKYEGFEMVTLEALSCGVPVVGGDVGAVSELAERRFPGIYRVDPDDPARVVESLITAARDWRAPAAKKLLHETTAASYGVAAWSRAMHELLDNANA